MIFAILATGESLTKEQVDKVKHLEVIAISDAYVFGAKYLVSSDAAWWRHHNPKFEGRKFSVGHVDGVERCKAHGGTNSGSLAIQVARELGATGIILLGYDGHGSHFFGSHPVPLKETPSHRRKVHHKQHQQSAFDCKFHGIPIFNCSPGTSIKAYPTATLDHALENLQR